MNKGKKKFDNNELSQFNAKGILNLFGVLCTISTIILLILTFASDTKYFIFAFLTFILSRTLFYFSDVSKN